MARIVAITFAICTLPPKPMQNCQLNIPQSQNKLKKSAPRWLLFSTPFLIFNLAFLTPTLNGKQATLLTPLFSLPASAQTPDPRKAEADRLNELGIQQFHTSQLEAALQSWQRALQLYRTIKDRRGEGQSLGNLGNAYHALGNYDKAIEYQQQRLVIAREIKDRRGEGVALGNLGLAYFSLGNYGKAIEYQQQHLVIAREIKDRLGEGQSLGNLGLAYYALGNYGKAIEYHQQSLVIAREIKNRRSEGAALGNLGLAYYALGNYGKAIEYQQQSLAIAREIKNRLGEGQSLSNLGIAYYSLGNYGKAIEYQEQSLAIAREIKDRLGEGQSLGNLGNAYHALGNYDKAIEYQQQRLAIAREIKNRLGEGQSLNNLGATFLSSGKSAAAEQLLYDAIAVWESLRPELSDANKVSLFETQQAAYRLLQESLIAQNKPTAALEIAERGRARAFVELLAKRLQGSPPPPLDTSGAAQPRGGAGGGGISGDATQQLAIKPPTIQQIKQIAKDHNATLVEYSILLDEALYIWVIKPSGDITFRQVNLKPTRSTPSSKPASTTSAAKTRSAFSDPVNALRTTIRGIGAVPKDPSASPSSKPLAFTADPRLIKIQLRNLHQQLIEPIADLLPSDPNQHLIFVPQGELFLVPFAALEDSSGKALIEKHTILTAPSIQVLELTRKERSVDAAAASRRVQRGVRSGNSDSLLLSPLSSLIVGNPTMPKIVILPGEPAEQLPPLPGAKKEAEAIAQFLNTSFLTGNQATKATVKQRMPGAKLIHLATHGLLDERNGIQSAIALAPSGQDNGLLTADEILDLSLQAELVVLSACDSGRGKLTGDGVIGLSRSLISAGVPSVLVSLWSVPDAPTAELMTEFYRQLKQNPDKAQALRQAMLATKKDHPNPIAWAAFTLIGEAE